MGIKILRPEEGEGVEELERWMENGTLIPVFGAGFTKGCRAKHGRVPSGADLKEDVINAIRHIDPAEPEDDLRTQRLQELVDTYETLSEGQGTLFPRDYLLHRFTEVVIEGEKKNVLQGPWPYVYTLNVDDGIEHNSDYKVLSANHAVREDIFDKGRYVIKIHGDVQEHLDYRDAELIFSTRAYLSSFEKNKSLLLRFQYDLSHNHILYIGCSLDEELDLLLQTSLNRPAVDVYYCGTEQELSLSRKARLEKRYGVSCYLQFRDFDGIYALFSRMVQRVRKKAKMDWETWRFREIRRLPADGDSQAYLFQGLALPFDRGIVQVPCFFIEREATEKIRKRVTEVPVLLVMGSASSGTSYLMADLAHRFPNEEVFVFDASVSLGTEALGNLLQGQRRILLLDDVLTAEQVRLLLQKRREIQEHKNHVVLMVHKSNREISNVLQLMIYRKEIPSREKLMTWLSRCFSQNDLERLNPELVRIRVPRFQGKCTILDNILSADRELSPGQKSYSGKRLYVMDAREMAAVIMLATKRKIYESDAYRMGLLSELQAVADRLYPLIDKEAVWPFERKASENAVTKYVINAGRWLYRELGRLAKEEPYHAYALDAYDLLVGRAVEIYGAPQLAASDFRAPYRQYMMVDEMNRIFEGASMQFIREIFERLNRHLASDPHYLHQRAKCHIRSAGKEGYRSADRWNYLLTGYQDAVVSASIFQGRYDDSRNEKLLISLFHVHYTEARALCWLCEESKDTDAGQLSRAVDAVYRVYLTDRYHEEDERAQFYAPFQKTLKQALLHKDLLDQGLLKQLECLANEIVMGNAGSLASDL